MFVLFCAIFARWELGASVLSNACLFLLLGLFLSLLRVAVVANVCAVRVFLLPHEKFGDVLLAEKFLFLDRAESIRVVFWRPIIVIVDHGIDEVRVKLFQFLGELVDGYRDGLQLGAIVVLLVRRVIVAGLFGRRARPPATKQAAFFATARKTIRGRVRHDQIRQVVGRVLRHA